MVGVADREVSMSYIDIPEVPVDYFDFALVVKGLEKGFAEIESSSPRIEKHRSIMIYDLYAVQRCGGNQLLVSDVLGRRALGLSVMRSGFLVDQRYRPLSLLEEIWPLPREGPKVFRTFELQKCEVDAYYKHDIDFLLVIYLGSKTSL